MFFIYLYVYLYLYNSTAFSGVLGQCPSHLSRQGVRFLVSIVPGVPGGSRGFQGIPGDPGLQGIQGFQGSRAPGLQGSRAPGIQGVGLSFLFLLRRPAGQAPPAHPPSREASPPGRKICIMM